MIICVLLIMVTLIYTNNDNNRLLVALHHCLATVTCSDVKLVIISQNKHGWSDDESVIRQVCHVMSTPLYTIPQSSYPLHIQ